MHPQFCGFKEETNVYVLAVDIGGTKLEASIFEASRIPEGNSKPDRVLGPIALTTPHPYYMGEKKRFRLPTDRVKGYPQIIDKIAQLALSCCQDWKIELSKLEAISLTLPGTVDPKTKRMRMGNALVFKDQDVSQDLKTKLERPDLPIFIENDANLFSIAEAYLGAGILFEKESCTPVKEHFMVGVILGTGVGGGVINEGILLKGRRGGGGEIGHMQLHSGGPACLCGLEGCVETFLSGVALESQMQSRRYPQLPEMLTAPEIFDLAASGEPVSSGLLTKYKRDLAKFIALLANVYDPDYVVFGGGMSQQAVIYEGLEEEVGKTNFLKTPIQVYQNRLGDSAGIIGAAIIAFESLLNTHNR